MRKITDRVSRRSRKEWARLVRTWRRSGVTSSQFAAEHGLVPRTLVWWAWQLGKRRTAALATPHDVPLVRVAVTPESTTEQAPAWEVVTASGHTLRVYGIADRETLRVVTAAIASTGRVR